MKNLFARLYGDLAKALASFQKKRALARAQKAYQKALQVEFDEEEYLRGSLYNIRATRKVAQCRADLEKLTGADSQGFISN